jgi:hypothetical protein
MATKRTISHRLPFYARPKRVVSLNAMLMALHGEAIVDVYSKKDKEYRSSFVIDESEAADIVGVLNKYSSSNIYIIRNEVAVNRE